MTSELNGSRIVGLSSVKDAPNRRDSTTSCDDMSGVSDVESKLHPQSVEPCHNLAFNTIRYNPAIVGNQLTNSAPIHFAVPQSSTFPGFPRLPPPAKVDEGEVHLPLHSTRLMLPRSSTSSRRSRHFVPNEHKDEYYWQKRKKNNEAARKSREKRRTIDSVLEDKVLQLSQENKYLRNELYNMKVKYGEIDPTAEDFINNNKHPKFSSSTSSPNHEMVDCEHAVNLQLATSQREPTNPVVVNNEVPISPITSFHSDICLRGKAAQAVAVVSPTLNTSHPPQQVNLLLGKLHGSCDDSAVSANVVFSRLATGTLVLSPVDLSIGSRSLKEAAPPASTSSLPESAAKKEEEGDYPNEMKAFEAANTLVTLCKGAEDLKRDVMKEEDEESKEQSGNWKPRFREINSLFNGDKSALPHKLRFKSSKSEQ
ncbi:uncharacterized protein LOC143460038 isoform X1 [Clavelina lepadiformis]|uniref:uncharacterized protein LOC143460038 isoform X1 n=1 Tax=Clavelina lepadiformis TaxID=159417 RepID=UPI0040428B90